MTNLVRLFESKRENQLTKSEILENIEHLRKVMEKFYKRRVKLLKDIEEQNPRSSERQVLTAKLRELEEKFKENVQKLGGRVNSIYRIRFASTDCFYIFDYRCKDLEKVPYER